LVYKHIETQTGLVYNTLPQLNILLPENRERQPRFLPKKLKVRWASRPPRDFLSEVRKRLPFALSSYA